MFLIQLDKLKYALVLQFITALLIACGNQETDSVVQEVKRSAFTYYVDSIPTLELPLVLKSDDAMMHFENPKEFVPEGAELIGKLPSLGNKHFIIYSYPADIRLPILEIYDDEGKKLKDVQLFKYNCPLDMGWFSKFSISKDYDIVIEQICDAYDSRIDRDTIRLQELLRMR